MKRLVFAAVIIMATAALFAQMPATGVSGTFHDMSLTSGYSVQISNAAGTFDQICVFCHTPHHAIGSVTGEDTNGAGAGGTELIGGQLIPLWNHETTATVFTMYNSTNNPLSDLQGTVDATVGGGSLACLSCHDGTLSMSAVRTAPYWAKPLTTFTDGTGAPGTTGHINLTTGVMTTSAWGLVGTDLTNDHPISITYDASDLALNDPTGLVGVKLFGVGGNVYDNKVECGSCHDAHNYGTQGTTAPFLRASMAGSAMCLQCHNK